MINETPVMILTGPSNSHFVKIVGDMAANGYILKPVKPDRLLGTIENALEHRHVDMTPIQDNIKAIMRKKHSNRIKQQKK